jgi:hypothetical protein
MTEIVESDPCHVRGRAQSHAAVRSLARRCGLLPIAVLLVGAFGSACGSFGPSGSCTLIGCTGLVVEVTGAPALTPVTIVLTAPDGSTRSASCTSATGGTCPMSFSDFTPASLTIRVTIGTTTTEVSRQPAYEVTRPNGPKCPPECRNARVTVAL